MKFLFGGKLTFDWKIVAVTILSTLLLLIDYYYRLTPSKYVDRFLLYFVIPFIVVCLVFREHPRHYGFTFGHWKPGLTLTLIACLLMTPIIYMLAQYNPGMKSYYAPYVSGLPWTTFLDLFGWEFFFRGFILFAYARKFGPEALWLQAVPFALAHMSKPDIETLSTIFGGFVFGWVAWRTKSFIYPFLIHWFIGTFVIVAAAGVI